MTARITKKKLQNKLDHINKCVNITYPFHLDFNPFYGGYCLESRLGSNRHSSRMSAREMMAFLRGMDLILDMMDRGTTTLRQRKE